MLAADAAATKGPPRRFGRLVVAGERIPGRRPRFPCRCDCGTEKLVREDHLKSGTTTSCGCYHRDVTRKTASRQFARHGYSVGGRADTTLTVWNSLRARCSNPKNKAYADYGARGIRVCERWLGPAGFANFLADMGDRPTGMTIDRIDNDGNYEPGNCRWADYKTQARNNRRNRVLHCFGESLTVAGWSERTGIGSSTILNRLRSGWDAQRAITTPTLRRGPVSKKGAASMVVELVTVNDDGTASLHVRLPSEDPAVGTRGRLVVTNPTANIAAVAGETLWGGSDMIMVRDKFWALRTGRSHIALQTLAGE